MLQVLEQLQHDHRLPAIVLDYRSKNKLLNGFVNDICSRTRRLDVDTGMSNSMHQSYQEHCHVCMHDVQLQSIGRSCLKPAKQHGMHASMSWCFGFYTTCISQEIATSKTMATVSDPD